MLENYYTPREIRRLPFNALRSGIYPQNKPTTDQAFERFFDDSQHVVTTLPKRMLYSKHKLPNAAGQFAQNGMSFVHATRAHDETMQLRQQYPGRQAVFTPRMAAEQINQLPSPQEDPLQTPIAKGLSNQAVIQPEAMAAYIESVQTFPSEGVPRMHAQTDLDSAHDWNSSPMGPIHSVLSGLRTGGLGATPSGSMDAPNMWARVYAGLGVAGGALALYHGYKRNRSVGWALVWGLFGTTFPLITTPLAFAQGFGDRKIRRGRR